MVNKQSPANLSEISISCPLCGNKHMDSLSDLTQRWLIPAPGNIISCDNCGVRMVWPQPPEELNNEFYEDEIYYREIVGRKRLFFQNRVKLIQYLTRPGQIELLDVGCGLGEMLIIAREEGFKVTGIELSKYASQYANEKFGLQVLNIPVEQAISCRYDIVHANHVLEHVHDPVQFVSQLYRLLKPDGVCIIEVPNEFMNLMAILNDLIMRPKYRTTPSLHLFFFSPKNLNKVMCIAGFNQIQIKTWSHQLMVTNIRKDQMIIFCLRNWFRKIADFTLNGENILCICRKSEEKNSQG
jgi:2-polyprenyl-3-methyl-5-hydroxy-6-metoxy-1,4-benzoquinol methylase